MKRGRRSGGGEAAEKHETPSKRARAAGAGVGSPAPQVRLDLRGGTSTTVGQIGT